MNEIHRRTCGACVAKQKENAMSEQDRVTTPWTESDRELLKMMDANSAVTKAEEQLEVQKQMVELLSQAQSDGSDDDLPEMDDLQDF